MTKPSYDELLEMLDNVSATAENLYHQNGQPMTGADRRARMKVIKQARDTCDKLLRPNQA